MDASAKKARRLLYVSDVDQSAVEVYAWPNPTTPVGVLTGFDEPQGECADYSGDVYITVTMSNELVEYKSGSLNPLRTIQDSGQYPGGCAIDPASGDLAVSNLVSASGTSGSISVYKGASGTPTNYSDPLLPTPYFLNYDKNGKLWIDGSSQPFGDPPEFAYAALTVKTGKFTNKTLTGGTVRYPGGVEYDGKYITVGDQQSANGEAVVYRTSGFKILGSSQLGTSKNSIVQYAIDGGQLAAADPFNSQIDLFGYPSGNGPTKILRDDYSLPEGAAITNADTAPLRNPSISVSR